MAIEIDQNTIIRLLVRRGSDAERNTVILAQGEPGFTLDGKLFVIGDGITPGGIKIPNVDDTTIGWSGTSPNYIEIKNNAIDNSKLALMPANTVKGNGVATTAQPTDIAISANSLLGRLNGVNSGNLGDLSLFTLFGSIFSVAQPNPVVTGLWFNLTTYKWYQYDGVRWLSVHQYGPSGPERLLYVGTGASVTTYDGGDSNAPGLSGGPMWEVDTSYTSRVLRGASLGAGATIPLTTGGADNITLTGNMLPPHIHNVKILIPGHGGNDGSRDAADGGRFSSPNSSDPTFNWTTGNPFTTGQFLQDGSGLPRVYEDYGNGNTTATAVPAPVPAIPSYQEVLVLKRTARVYYVIV